MDPEKSSLVTCPPNMVRFFVTRQTLTTEHQRLRPVELKRRAFLTHPPVENDFYLTKFTLFTGTESKEEITSIMTAS